MKFNFRSKNNSLKLSEGDVLLNITGIEEYSNQDKEQILGLISQMKDFGKIKSIEINKKKKLQISRKF